MLGGRIGKEGRQNQVQGFFLGRANPIGTVGAFDVVSEPNDKVGTRASTPIDRCIAWSYSTFGLLAFHFQSHELFLALLVHDSCETSRFCSIEWS